VQVRANAIKGSKGRDSALRSLEKLTPGKLGPRYNTMFPRTTGIQRDEAEWQWGETKPA